MMTSTKTKSKWTRWMANEPLAIVVVVAVAVAVGAVSLGGVDGAEG